MTTTNSPAAQPQGAGLLPCRFCRGKQAYFAERNVGWLEDREIDRRIVVVCSSCGAQGPAFGLMSFNNESTAAQYWNDDTRADLPRATADALDGQRFHELMQAYRRATIGDRNAVAEAFEAVKSFVNAMPRATAETVRKLTLPELNHLLALLEAERQSGEYAGPREQYYARTERLMKWCQEQING